MAHVDSLSGDAAQVLDVLMRAKGDFVEAEEISRRLRIERWQAIALFKEIDALGMARYVIGRRTQPTRLVKTPATSSYLLDTKSAPVAAAQKAPSGDADQATQALLLMRDRPFTVTVPADLTEAEATRISRWLAVVASNDE